MMNDQILRLAHNTICDLNKNNLGGVLVIDIQNYIIYELPMYINLILKRPKDSEALISEFEYNLKRKIKNAEALIKEKGERK